MNLFEYLKHIDNDSHEMKSLMELIEAQLPYPLILDCKASLIYIDSDLDESRFNVTFSPLTGNVGSQEPTTLSIEERINSCSIAIEYDSNYITFVSGSGGLGNAVFTNEQSQDTMYRLIIEDHSDSNENSLCNYDLLFNINDPSSYVFGITDIELEDAEGNVIEAKPASCTVTPNGGVK